MVPTITRFFNVDMVITIFARSGRIFGLLVSEVWGYNCEELCFIMRVIVDGDDIMADFGGTLDSRAGAGDISDYRGNILIQPPKY